MTITPLYFPLLNVLLNYLVVYFQGFITYSPFTTLCA